MLNLLSFAGVMKSLGGVVLAVAILLVMVTIHEFGHYIAGKILGFKINEFAVGFGPALFKKRRIPPAYDVRHSGIRSLRHLPLWSSSLTG